MRVGFIGPGVKVDDNRPDRLCAREGVIGGPVAATTIEVGGAN